MLPVPLLAEAERVQALGSVHGKYAVQMVNFVLE
jgi:hypothetical protein